MRQIVVAAMLSACFAAGAARAAEDCGPGCHSTAQGACVVNGWEVGAGGWNECPAGAHPRTPCSQRYVWHRHARACLPAN